MFGETGILHRGIEKLQSFAEPGSLFSANPDWPGQWWIYLLAAIVISVAIYYELTHDAREEEAQSSKHDDGAGIIQGPFADCKCESHHVHGRNGPEGCPECNPQGSLTLDSVNRACDEAAKDMGKIKPNLIYKDREKNESEKT